MADHHMQSEDAGHMPFRRFVAFTLGGALGFMVPFLWGSAVCLLQMQYYTPDELVQGHAWITIFWSSFSKWVLPFLVPGLIAGIFLGLMVERRVRPIDTLIFLGIVASVLVSFLTAVLPVLLDLLAGTYKVIRPELVVVTPFLGALMGFLLAPLWVGLAFLLQWLFQHGTFAHADPNANTR
jgi:hypothetical protein